LDGFTKVCNARWENGQNHAVATQPTGFPLLLAQVRPASPPTFPRHALNDWALLNWKVAFLMTHMWLQQIPKSAYSICIDGSQK